MIFTLIAGGLLAAGMFIRDRDAKEDIAAAERKIAADKPAPEAEDNKSLDVVAVEFGRGLTVLVSSTDAALPGKIKTLRETFQEGFGFLLPTVRIKQGDGLAHNAYRVLVHGVEVAKGELRPGGRLIIDPDNQAQHFAGERVKEPTFGLNAVWIDTNKAAEAEAEGFARGGSRERHCHPPARGSAREHA